MASKIPEVKTIYDPKTKTWSGFKKESLYKENVSLGQVAVETLLKNPDHIAQICYTTGKTYTNREIATLSIRVAQHFKKLNVQQCQVIGICASNSDFLAPLFFGAMLAGLTVSTLDPTFDKDGIKHIFSVTKPTMMFCDGGIYETVKEAFEESNLQSKLYTMKDHIEGVSEITEFLQETGTEQDFKAEPLKMGSSQTAAIMCSSGTTGLPKGVCVSHISLLNMQVFNLIPEDKLLGFSTLYWLSGVMCLVVGTIKGATRVISDRGFSPIDFFDIIEKHKVTVIFTPPSQIALSVASSKIADYDMSSVVSFLSGGSAVPYSLVEKIKPYMPNAEFFTGYGMTEMSGPVAFGLLESKGSTGQLTANVDVKIINDDGKLLGPGERGEICLRSPFPWAGYYGNPEATAAAYNEDGWILSGDIGYFDEQGNLYIVDRKKEILKYNNYHFFPTEIEKCIIEMPEVAEVCVCGIPDIVSTYLPAAAIVRMEGSQLTEKDVYNYVAERMVHFKHLHGGVYFIDDLPKTVSGKNLRRKVTEICADLRKSKISPQNNVGQVLNSDISVRA